MPRKPRITRRMMQDHARPGLALRCACGEFSATPGDYFLSEMDEPLPPCDVCGVPWSLGYFEPRVWREVTP